MACVAPPLTSLVYFRLKRVQTFKKHLNRLALQRTRERGNVGGGVFFQEHLMDRYANSDNSLLEFTQVKQSHQNISAKL